MKCHAHFKGEMIKNVLVYFKNPLINHEVRKAETCVEEQSDIVDSDLFKS